VDSIYDIVWARDPETGRAVTYGDVRLADEVQFSVYNFEKADIKSAWEHFNLYEAECQKLVNVVRGDLGSLNDRGGAVSRPTRNALELGGEERAWQGLRAPILAAYDLCLKCSHLFNILDARGAISVTERVGVIARVRALAVGIAKAYVDQQNGERNDLKSDEEPAARKKMEVVPI
jgi:glycyl-tRNA synthetase alpha chain